MRYYRYRDDRRSRWYLVHGNHTTCLTVLVRDTSTYVIIHYGDLAKKRYDSDRLTGLMERQSLSQFLDACNYWLINATFSQAEPA